MVSCLQPFIQKAHSEGDEHATHPIELRSEPLLGHITVSAPEFHEQIALNAQHILVIHNGSSPRCTSTPNSPQRDCYKPGPEPRAFSVFSARNSLAKW